MRVELDESTKVKPCPLCGDEAFLHTDTTLLGSTLFWIKCPNLQCGCTANSSDDREKTLAGWNRRG